MNKSFNLEKKILKTKIIQYGSKKLTRTKKNIKKKKIGYTTGVFDYSYWTCQSVKKCKAYCDKLIVGVTVDELVKYKHKKPVIPFWKIERRQSRI